MNKELEEAKDFLKYFKCEKTKGGLDVHIDDSLLMSTAFEMMKKDKDFLAFAEPFLNKAGSLDKFLPSQEELFNVWTPLLMTNKETLEKAKKFLDKYYEKASQQLRQQFEEAIVKIHKLERQENE